MREECERRLHEHDTLSDFIIDCISERIRRADDDGKSTFREVQVFPSKSEGGDDSGNPIDRRFEDLIARHGLATAASGGHGELDPGFAKVLRKVLTRLQYRRLKMQLTSEITMEKMAHLEGCAKQAIHTSLQAAKARILGSEEVKRYLKDIVMAQSIEGGGSYGKRAIENGEMSFDRMLQLVAGGTAIVGDISGGDKSKFHRTLAMAMKPIMTAIQFRRFEAYMVGGLSFRQIAFEEDCSVNSVAKSIKYARNRLRASVPVAKALCKLFADTIGSEVNSAAIIAEVQRHQLDIEEDA
jgi:predicted DNA-binding protein YlxM (UPF0122 family)